MSILSGVKTKHSLLLDQYAPQAMAVVKELLSIIPKAITPCSLLRIGACLSTLRTPILSNVKGNLLKGNCNCLQILTQHY